MLGLELLCLLKEDYRISRTNQEYSIQKQFETLSHHTHFHADLKLVA